ncbi:MAG: carbon-nitrogen hydrolase family protein [Thermomicrobiales bacterium]|nr:carbon-nitrogen hydrolase family protein [Thermomicrobiales bacterium]
MTTLKIGLAAVRNPATVEERMAIVERVMLDAAAQKVAIVCFPEAYLPGLRGLDFEVPPADQARQKACLARLQGLAKRANVAAIMGMEWQGEQGLLNVAFVIDRNGDIQGMQPKNQIAPSEDPYYVPGGERRLFEIDGVPFGITICHEGWRYPESVRWSAVRGARIVFHPQITGSDFTGPTLTRWGDPDAPYYEKAMILRACENEIWFASVNSAFEYQESATTVIAPDGAPAAWVPYGEEALLVHEIDLARATGIYADRYRPEFYPE